MSIFRKPLALLASRVDGIRNAFDLRDVFLFCGLGLVGYGLYQYRPWIAFTICGTLLMLIGYLMRESR